MTHLLGPKPKGKDRSGNRVVKIYLKDRQRRKLVKPLLAILLLLLLEAHNDEEPRYEKENSQIKPDRFLARARIYETPNRLHREGKLFNKTRHDIGYSSLRECLVFTSKM